MMTRLLASGLRHDVLMTIHYNGAHLSPTGGGISQTSGASGRVRASIHTIIFHTCDRHLHELVINIPKVVSLYSLLIEWRQLTLSMGRIWRTSYPLISSGVIATWDMILDGSTMIGGPSVCADKNPPAKPNLR